MVEEDFQMRQQGLSERFEPAALNQMPAVERPRTAEPG